MNAATKNPGWKTLASWLIALVLYALLMALVCHGQESGPWTPLGGGGGGNVYSNTGTFFTDVEVATINGHILAVYVGTTNDSSSAFGPEYTTNGAVVSAWFNTNGLSGGGTTTGLGFSGSFGNGQPNVPAVTAGAPLYCSPAGTIVTSGQVYNGFPLPAGTYTNLLADWSFNNISAGTNLTMNILTNGQIAMTATLVGPATASQDNLFSNTVASFKITQNTRVSIVFTNNSSFPLTACYISWSVSRINQ